ncbi:MAG: UDP-N-acetylmuramoyl-tripeptide--D-alanyl-D-alanine ligase [Oscillospiraceae bacterium]|nr:UDP-N-acetylmuramoyl-tripeptide--D-alanyl-D-alanine ligase [Oscillospiraceae bacterium]
MKNLSLKEIAKAVGGIEPADIIISEIFTDSRKKAVNGLFFAIKGDRFDGHDFINEAGKNGAAAVVCHKEIKTNLPVIMVADTKKAYLQLGGYYRGLFDIPFVALTGSAGKTTTKDMVHAVLSAKYRTLKTEGNLNNEIGVPATLFRVDEKTEAAVIEMGMNHAGEISPLSKAVKPDAAVITNIGAAHIENLKSREGILKAKLEILDGMDNSSPVILNGDDKYLKNAPVGRRKAVFYALENNKADIKASAITQSDSEIRFSVETDGEKKEVALPAVGVHNVYNALAAIAAGKLLGVGLKDAAEALKNYAPPAMRQNIEKINGITIINDCYNSNPDSVKAALNALSAIPGNRKIAVLGDMLELGEYSAEAHEQSGAYAAETGAKAIFTFGKCSEKTAEAAKNHGITDVFDFIDIDEITAALTGYIKEGDAVLFKASRGMKIERVIDNLQFRPRNSQLM